MSGKEDPEGLPELKEIREALGSLVPRTDRLNRERLMFLAGQASVGKPSEQLPRTRVWSRWGWPAAFSAMSAVAASLLVTVAVRPEPQVVVRVVERVVPAPVSQAEAKTAQSAPAGDAPGAVQEQDQPSGAGASPGRESVPSEWFAWAALVGRSDGSSTEPSYPQLREQLLAHGVESWEYPAAPTAAPTSTSDGPMPYRDQWDRILQQQGWGGSLPRAPSPKVPNRPGVES